MKKIELSSLGHTWLIDIDGTIVKHNGYKIDGFDTLLPGVLDFWKSIPQGDVIILLTSRAEKFREITESFLKRNGIWFTCVIYNLPYGERILVNDNKPSGLLSSYALSLDRNKGIDYSCIIKENL